MNAKLAGLALLLAGCVADAGATKQRRCPEVTPEVEASVEKTHAGVKAIQQRQFEAAIGHLQEAVGLATYNHAAWFQLGIAYDALDRPDEAIRAYDRATVAKPDDGFYWLKLGLTLYETRLEDGLPVSSKTKRALQQAVDLQPDFYRAHHTLGVIAAAEQPKEAAASFVRAISIAPQEAASYVELGRLYLDWGYFAEAVEVLSRGDAHVVGSGRAAVRLELGRAFADLGNPTAAIDAFTRALEDDKNLHDARFERGMTYLAAKELAKAELDLTQFQSSGWQDLAWSIAATALERIR